MGIIGTAIGVSIGTRRANKERPKDVYRKARSAAADRSKRWQANVAPFLVWFDALPDNEAQAHSAYVLGASRGSRFADREALIARQLALPVSGW